MTGPTTTSDSTEGSAFACPTCDAALRRLSRRAADLFCRACGTAVALLEGDACFFLHLGDHPRLGRATLVRRPTPPAES